jgi:hypothetical protein
VNLHWLGRSMALGRRAGEQEEPISNHSDK